MSVATFDNTMSNIVVELDDREIYNDVRSAIDTTVTTVVLDNPEVYGLSAAIEVKKQVLPNGQTVSVTLTASDSVRPVLEWSAWSAVGYYATTQYTGGAIPAGSYLIVIGVTSWLAEQVALYVTVSASDDTSITLSVTNNSGYDAAEYTVQAYGKYLKSDAITHEETGMRTLTIRETDETSINAYGRRVLNLAWPLGQTQAVTESLAEAYKERQKHAVPRLKMTVRGTTEALVEQIFTRTISDLITVINDDLGLNADFYINATSGEHTVGGVVTVVWDLELQRVNEAVTFFTISSSTYNGSEINGTDVIAA